MSNKETEEEKSEKKIYKAYSISAKYKKAKINTSPLSPLEQKEKKTRNIFQNAGKELINSNSDNYISTENHMYNSFNSPISYSIINPKHKGIKIKGHDLYDPYLLQVCKSAIYREKKELPNYKEIIQRVNTEFGIENEKYNDIDLYYKNLIDKANKNLENYITSIKNEKKVKRVFQPKIDSEEKEKE